MDFTYLIQARLGSTRLRGKMLLEIYNNKTLLELVYQRVLLSNNANPDNVFVLISNNPSDDIFEYYLIEKNINYFRGEEDNVYERFHNFLITSKIETKYIFRICGDNPLIEPIFIDEMAQYLKKNVDVDYLSYKDHKDIPAILTHYGFFCESIKLSTFKKAKCLINNNYEKQHVTPIFYNSQYFNKKFLDMPSILKNHEYRFTVDTKEDFNNIKYILKDFKNYNYSYMDVINLVENNPVLLERMQERILLNRKEQT